MSANGYKTSLPKSTYAAPYVKTSWYAPHLSPTGMQYKSKKLTPRDPYKVFGGGGYQSLDHGYRYDTRR